jgi:hypothetical protein
MQHHTVHGRKQSATVAWTSVGISYSLELRSKVSASVVVKLHGRLSVSVIPLLSLARRRLKQKMTKLTVATPNKVPKTANEKRLILSGIFHAFQTADFTLPVKVCKLSEIIFKPTNLKFTSNTTIFVMHLNIGVKRTTKVTVLIN